MGIALAYGTSSTKGNSSYASNSNNAGLSLDKVNSNMIEVGLYNSYVADSGWYNDTILKFDYIMSEFSLSNGSGVMSETNNFAMVLSDEFGYRYSFAENEKGSWYIDPQVEVAFGYFNQSDFNRAVDSLTTLKATQDSILTLRSRIGASLGKKFTTDKGFASLYVGASYEYDYIEGGDSGVSTREGGLITQLDKVESNGRAVLNVGSNIELTKGARLYIDVEK
ncbi:autotransporter outer membrane beta-barrel domain-containing protein, partial [Helicobacter brantae]